MIGMHVDPFHQSVTNYPATATQASVSSATPTSAKAFTVTTALSACIVAGAAPEVQKVTYRDGTGAGTILWSTTLAAPANGMARFDLVDLNIVVPTPGNQATLQFEAAGAVGSQQSVSMTSYDTSQVNDSRALGRMS
jgi:hypothetical protein